MKDKPTKPLRALEVSDHTEKLLVHERLQAAIAIAKPLKVFKAVPLDSRDIPVSVYGKNYYSHEKTISGFLATLKKGHTLTRSEVISNRQPYASESFFVSPEGYFEDPDQSCKRLLNLLDVYADFLATLVCSMEKTHTVRHNLKLAEVIATDALVFVESLQVEHTFISTDTERHSRRSSVRDLANHT